MEKYLRLNPIWPKYRLFIRLSLNNDRRHRRKGFFCAWFEVKQDNRALLLLYKADEDDQFDIRC